MSFWADPVPRNGRTRSVLRISFSNIVAPLVIDRTPVVHAANENRHSEVSKLVSILIVTASIIFRILQHQKKLSRGKQLIHWRSVKKIDR